MPVGYGYDKNTQPLFIDWSEISKSFTDEIKARKEKGETEKQSILDNRQEFDKLLVDRPSGQNEVANAVITSAVDQIKEYSLANFNRYKDKQTTLGQYKNFENNLNSSTSLLFDAVGNFNKNFDEFATRAQNGTASQIEVFMHEMMQNYTDFGRIAVNVDPRTGSIIIGQLDENGEVTDKTLDVSQLGYFSKYKRDTYNINGEVAKVADALGTKFIQDSSGKSLKYQGMMYDELVNNEELMKGLDAEVNSLIDQGFELESVLADSMGYKIVTDKSDNPNELYFNQDSNEFEISDTQKQAAFQHVRDKLARAITVERKEPQPDKPKDKVRETLDIINTVRLSGGEVNPKLFTQMLKDLGLTEDEINATFPNGIDEDVYKEFNTDLTKFVRGITAEQIMDAIKNDKPLALNQQLYNLRQLGISSRFVEPTRAEKRVAEQNDQDIPQGFITINSVGGKAVDEFKIPITDGMSLTSLISDIVSEIPVYQSPDDIMFRLLIIAGGTPDGAAPGAVDYLFFNNDN